LLEKQALRRHVTSADLPEGRPPRAARRASAHGANALHNRCPHVTGRPRIVQVKGRHIRFARALAIPPAAFRTLRRPARSAFPATR
jgi:hypothetical protein